MLGERSGQRYRLGDRLQVKLVRADLETGRIDFVLASPPQTVREAPAKLAASPFVKPQTKPARKPVDADAGRASLLKKPHH